MEKIINVFSEFNTYSVIIRLLAAAVMGGIIGSERGRHGRPAGLRTHILICVGAAMTSLTGLYLTKTLGVSSDAARISAQVISGIGFLGAGTIMIRNSSVITGLTTAAGMWATAAIGVTIGYGFYSAAICATLIGILSVTLLTRLEKKRKSTISVYIEFTDILETENIIEKINSLEDAVASLDIIPAKSGHLENVGIMLVLHGKKHLETLKNSLSEAISIAMIVGDINN